MQEEEEKTFAGRFDKYCGSRFVAIISAVMGGAIYVTTFIPPLTFPPTPEEIIFRLVVPFGLAILITGIPLWLILQFIVWPRLQSDNQPSTPEESV